MRNLRMVVAYVGTRYAGWQVQPGIPTIQGVLEDRASRMLRGPVRLAGAGRTDAGVHARGQVANFLTESRIPPAGLVRGLNALLPADISVMRADEVEESFHARADARGKEYRYRIVSADVVSPFEAPFVASVRGRLDAVAMRAAARHFLGTHDFTSFCPVASPIENKVRTLRVSEVDEDDGRLTFRVVGDGFLRHMVRTLAGTLIWVGGGRLDAAAIPAIMAGRDRRLAGPVAPASGLILEQVFYGETT